MPTPVKGCQKKVSEIKRKGGFLSCVKVALKNGHFLPSVSGYFCLVGSKHRQTVFKTLKAFGIEALLAI
jgi:hypothetical protein